MDNQRNYIIESVSVDGFQGYRHFKHHFHPQKNFFIGRNGTGKTQLITLLKAGLSADTSAMTEIKFQKLLITLQAKGQPKKAYISYIKEKRKTEREEIDGITVKFQVGRDGKELTYFWSPEMFPFFDTVHDRAPVRYRIATMIRELINFDWLSLIRGEIYIPDDFESDEPPIVRDPVSQKVEENSSRVSSLFAELDRSANKLVAEFQRNFLLSYLDSSMDEKVFNIIGSLNEKKVLEAKEDILDAFEKLELPQALYIDKIETHFTHAKRAIDKYQNAGGIDIQELAVLIDSLRLARLAGFWRSTQEKMLQIYEERDQFLRIITDLFFHKEAFLNRGNFIKFSYHEDAIGLEDLSSGEKQMFIVLSEALLQRNQPVIYLADEPELSMHIEWQLDLVKNIRELNSECQIIFATHSPEIVANHQDFVFDMEAF